MDRSVSSWSGDRYLQAFPTQMTLFLLLIPTQDENVSHFSSSGNAWYESDSRDSDVNDSSAFTPFRTQAATRGNAGNLQSSLQKSVPFYTGRGMTQNNLPNVPDTNILKDISQGPFLSPMSKAENSVITQPYDIVRANPVTVQPSFKPSQPVPKMNSIPAFTSQIQENPIRASESVPVRTPETHNFRIQNINLSDSRPLSNTSSFKPGSAGVSSFKAPTGGPSKTFNARPTALAGTVSSIDNDNGINTMHFMAQPQLSPQLQSPRRAHDDSRSFMSANNAPIPWSPRHTSAHNVQPMPSSDIQNAPKPGFHTHNAPLSPNHNAPRTQSDARVTSGGDQDRLRQAAMRMYANRGPQGAVPQSPLGSPRQPPQGASNQSPHASMQNLPQGPLLSPSSQRHMNNSNSFNNHEKQKTEAHEASRNNKIMSSLC